MTPIVDGVYITNTNRTVSPHWFFDSRSLLPRIEWRLAVQRRSARSRVSGWFDCLSQGGMLRQAARNYALERRERQRCHQVCHGAL